MSVLLILSLLSLAFGRLEIANREYPHVTDEYLITYHKNTTDEQATAHWGLMEYVGVDHFIHKYNVKGFKGFAAKITDQSILEALQEDPLVFAIQVNGIAYAHQTCSKVASPSWGLGRVSHFGTASNGVPNEYLHHNGQTGTGVEIFIIDTGIYIEHNDFGGKARWGIAFADGGREDDGNGHGTHCAGTAAGTTYGIAKGATLVAVKVLSAGGSGTWADVVAGVNWVQLHAKRGAGVASMSLGGGGTNDALTEAINACVDAGIPVVVAAGNSYGDACSFTPANIPSVISVGATEMSGPEGAEFDSKSAFSNYGRCTHIYAPGRDIVSAWIGSTTAANTISGTSMACPHVAGQVAVLLGVDPTLSPAAIKQRLQDSSQKGLIQNLVSPDSPNFLLYNGCR